VENRRTQYNVFSPFLNHFQTTGLITSYWEPWCIRLLCTLTPMSSHLHIWLPWWESDCNNIWAFHDEGITNTGISYGIFRVTACVYPVQ